MEQDFRQPEEATPKVETVYVEPLRERFPCGTEFVRDYWNAEKTSRHPRTCFACRVILGTSRASVMPQDSVAAAFVSGVTRPLRSGTNNYRSDRDSVVHYNTLELLRLRDGTVVRSSQCWSAGFASCGRARVDVALPLSTIGEIIGWGAGESWAGRDIVILDHTESEVLFAHGGRTFLFGHDNGRPYLVELKDRVGTVYEALVSMAPREVIGALANDVPVLRQGEWWLIRQEPTEKEREFVSIRARFKESATTGMKRRLIRPAIEKGSAHTAGEVLDAEGRTFVRGTVRHARREHEPIALGNVWHLAVRNANILTAWQVPRRGLGGGID